MLIVFTAHPTKPPPVQDAGIKEPPDYGAVLPPLVGYQSVFNFITGHWLNTLIAGALFIAVMVSGLYVVWSLGGFIGLSLNAG